MVIVDRSKFSREPDHDGFASTVQLGGRNANVSVRSSTGNIEQAWNQAELVLTFLRDQMPSVEEAVRDLFSRIGTPNEDTPKGRRKIERMLGELRESGMTCRIYDDGAAVYFDTPRMTDHIIELQFTRGGKLALATIAG